MSAKKTNSREISNIARPTVIANRRRDMENNIRGETRISWVMHNWIIMLLSIMRSQNGVWFNAVLACSPSNRLVAVGVRAHDECTFYKYKWLRMLERVSPATRMCTKVYTVNRSLAVCVAVCFRRHTLSSVCFFSRLISSLGVFAPRRNARALILLWLVVRYVVLFLLTLTS